MPANANALGYVRVALALALAYACWRVLAPFAPALCFAIAIVVSAWPAHAWLLGHLGNRRALASLLSCVLVAIVILGPVLLLLVAFREGAAWLIAMLDASSSDALTSRNDWLDRIPGLEALWRRVASFGISGWIAQIDSPVRSTLMSAGRAFGNALAQVFLAALLLFTLFSDGDRIAQRIAQIAEAAGGKPALEMLRTIHQTILGVTLGVIGTALAQAVVAAIGFTIVGAPNAFLLGALTFILSLVPIGPPLVWGAVAIWLFRDEHPGWAVFMLVYGIFGISLIDNIIKPLLISRANRLPFALTFMGVLGGVVAFGIAGVFIGPAVLAVAKVLLERLPSKSAAVSR